jgi:hypothetical protein
MPRGMSSLEGGMGWGGFNGTPDANYNVETPKNLSCWRGFYYAGESMAF